MKQSVFLLILLFFLTSCGQETSTSYQIPKEPASPPTSPGMGSSVKVKAAPAPSLSFTCELPMGWSEVSGSGMRKVSYTISGSSVDFYLISLAMGDVPSNVNRWRGQVGLAQVSSEEIEKEVQSFQITGRSVNYIEIYNEEDNQGIIATIIDLAPEYWYFTAKGPVLELKAHAADIRTFLESIKFEGHTH